jgi:Rap1a immunity proteins
MKLTFAVFVVAATLSRGVARADGPTTGTYFLKGKSLVEQMREWEKSVRSDPKTDVVAGSAFVGFVTGVHDSATGICTPFGVKIARICEISASYLNHHPEEWEKPAYSLVAKALGQAYPCGTEKRAETLPTPAAPLQIVSPRPLAATPQGAARRTSRRRGPSTDCESDHWIESVSDEGDIIKLEDGSIWEVDGGDTVTSSLWLGTTEVLVCEAKGKMINVDDNESVAVTRLK